MAACGGLLELVYKNDAVPLQISLLTNSVCMVVYMYVVPLETFSGGICHAEKAS